MSQNVIITLKGIQTTSDNQTNTIELMSEGKLYKRGESYYIVYQETEITGLEGTTTTVKITGDVVSLIRFGTVSSTLVFEKGKSHASHYGTNYGSLEIVISTNEARINIGDEGGEVYVEYDVEMSGQALGYNNFYIKVSPVKTSNNG